MPALHTTGIRNALMTATPRIPSPSGSNFTMSLFDKMWHPELTQEQAVTMMEAGIEEVKRRLVVAPPHYIIKVVDKDGIRTVKTV